MSLAFANDTQSLLLFARLELQDIDELRSDFQGEGIDADAAMAAQLYADELDALLASLGDLDVAQTLTNASPIIRVGTLLPMPPDDIHEGDVPTSPVLSITPELFASEPPGEPAGPGRASLLGDDVPNVSPVSPSRSPLVTSSRPLRASQAKVAPRVYCISCTDSILLSEATLLPCGHCLDRTCAGDMFRLSINGGGTFPPRCCQNVIPLAVVRTRFADDAAILRQLELKELESQTSNRHYCPTPTCSKFLGSTSTPEERQVVDCPWCSAQSCSACKERHPDGRWDDACPAADNITQQTIDLAQREGWQRCPACRVMVERLDGCNHMTCEPPCGAQFCYSCGKAWNGPCLCTGAFGGGIEIGRPIPLEVEPDIEEA